MQAVFCTFDLKQASSEQYRTAYGLLADLGLRPVVVSDEGVEVVVPTTSVLGVVSGVSGPFAADRVRDIVQMKFAAHRLESEIFVMSDQRWAAGITKSPS